MTYTPIPIVYGSYRGKLVDLGPVYFGPCTTCNESQWWRRETNQRVRHAMFVPVMKGRRQEWLVCPGCGGGHELTKFEADVLDGLMARTAALGRGELDQQEWDSEAAITLNHFRELQRLGWEKYHESYGGKQKPPDAEMAILVRELGQALHWGAWKRGDLTE